MRAKLYTVPSYSQAILEASKLIAKTPRDIDKPVVVFTPVKNSMLLESFITEVKGGYLNTRVFSFGKYIEYNKDFDGILSREGSVMVVRKILGEADGKLSCFKTCTVSLAENIYDSIALLKSAKVSLEDLLNAINSTDGVLYAKLSDLLYVYEEYEKFLSNGYFDESDMISVMPKILLSDDKIAETEVFLVGFDSWTRQAREIVSTLLQRAKSVTAVLVAGFNDGVYTNETADAFISLASSLNIKVSSERLGDISECSEAILNRTYSEKAFNAPVVKTDKVELFESPSILEEIEFLASTIRKGVLGGNKYKDYTVAVGTPDDYSDVIEKIFADYCIPYYFDKKKRFITHPLAKLVLSYVDACRKNLAQDAVLSLVKNPLFEKDKNLIDKFENFVIKRNVKFNGFYKNFTDLEDNVTDIEELRKRLVGNIIACNGMMNVDHYIKAINGFLDCLMVKDNLSFYAEVFAKTDPSEAEYTSKALESLKQVLTFVSKLMGNVKLDAKEFLLLLKTGFSAMEISIIPQSNDAVYVGGYKDCGNATAKYLFAVGLNGAVPEIKQDIAVLSDNDISRLHQLKVIIEPKVRAVNAREREIFVTALSAFSDKLYLSYSTTGRNGKSIKKSEALMYIEKIFALNAKSVIAVDGGADGYLTSAQSSKRFAIEVGKFKNGIINDFSGASAYYYATNDTKTAQKILESADVSFAKRLDNVGNVMVKEYVSASMLERFYSCPFRCFMDYGLKLTEREVGEIKPQNSGNFIHLVVELYATAFKDGKITDEKSSNTVTAQIVDDIVKTSEYAVYADDLTMANVLLRLKSEAFRVTDALYKQLTNTDFSVFGAEVKFGFDGSPFKPIYLTGKKANAKVRGAVDRIDTYGKYFRVVDYKTGKAEMKDAELYMGQKLQLFLYLNAFSDENRVPAGTYYYKLSDDYSDANEEKPAQLDGKTVNIEEVLYASDTSVLPDEKSAITGVKISKPSSNAVIDEENLALRMKYAKTLSEKAVDYMSDGVSIASPYEVGEGSSCQYCPYGAICGYEKDVSGYVRKKKPMGNNFMNAVLEKIKDE